MYGAANKRWNIGIRDPLFFRTGISREGIPIFHPVSKENEERNLAPMCVNGVKFITIMAACLSAFEYRPAKPTTNIKGDPDNMLEGATPKRESTESTEWRWSQ